MLPMFNRSEPILVLKVSPKGKTYWHSGRLWLRKRHSGRLWLGEKVSKCGPKTIPSRSARKSLQLRQQAVHEAELPESVRLLRHRLRDSAKATRERDLPPVRARPAAAALAVPLRAGQARGGAGGREAISTLFCPSQEKFHTVALRGVRNISEAP